MQPTYEIPALPPPVELETNPVLRQLSKTHRFLAELKGKAAAIPNQGILLNTLFLQEARASSIIENIVTTQDELFRHGLHPEPSASPAAKEVSRYANAMWIGFNGLKASDGLLTNNTIIAMFRSLKQVDGGFRNTPGTHLRNEMTGAIVHVPPQNPAEIVKCMGELETFINSDPESGFDPLIKMALIHHQFESIHPFSDGNGRIGRMINVLYLVRAGLLDSPILYASRYINAHKGDYYRELQNVRDTGEWESWLLFMLRAVAETSQTTLSLVEGIRDMMASAKRDLRTHHPKLYSQDLLNNLFRHPYTRIEYVQAELGVSRPTATKYLEELVISGIVEKYQSGRNNYYINRPLVDLLTGISE